MNRPAPGPNIKIYAKERMMTNKKWQTLILLSLAELLGMSLWFSASAAAQLAGGRG